MTVHDFPQKDSGFNKDWRTYTLTCSACNFRFEDVVHKHRMTWIGCPKCATRSAAVDPKDFIARFWHWRTSSFANANLLDCNHVTQQIYTRYASELIDNLNKAGFNIVPIKPEGS